MFSGRDNCGAGDICWEGDHQGLGVFRCTRLCSGAFPTPDCPPDSLCSIFSEWLAVCEEPACDPVAQDCPDDELCIPNIALWEDWCIPDDSALDGQLHDPCEAETDCAKGLLCIPAEGAAGECDLLAPGCCEPFCEFGAPCAGEGQECRQYYDIDHGFGVCKLP